MNIRALSVLARIVPVVFVRLRLIQVLIVCAIALVFIRAERLYYLNDILFVNAATASLAVPQKTPTAPPTGSPAPTAPATPSTAPSPSESATPPPEATPVGKADAPASGFPKDKPAEGFKAENFDILELSPDQVEVLRTLSKRHRDLVQRERSISEREATLQAIEQRLDQKTDEMKKIQEYLQQLLGQKSEKEQEALKKLVAIYEKMKPAEAANILQGLDLETLLNIMEGMKEAKESAILAKMEPLRARIITIELAQRRKKLEEKMQKQQEVSTQQTQGQPPVATGNPEAPGATDPQAPAAPASGSPGPAAPAQPANTKNSDSTAASSTPAQPAAKTPDVSPASTAAPVAPTAPVAPAASLPAKDTKKTAAKAG